MTIEQIRNEIDEIDAAIVGLLDQRAAAAKDIASLKTQSGLPVADPGRERDIFGRLRVMHSGLIDDRAIVGIYEIILNESKRIQREARGEISAVGSSL